MGQNRSAPSLIGWTAYGISVGSSNCSAEKLGSAAIDATCIFSKQSSKVALAGISLESVGGTLPRPNRFRSHPGINSKSPSARPRCRKSIKPYCETARCPTCQAIWELAPFGMIDQNSSGTFSKSPSVYLRAKSTCPSTASRMASALSRGRIVVDVILWSIQTIDRKLQAWSTTCLDCLVARQYERSGPCMETMEIVSIPLALLARNCPRTKSFAITCQTHHPENRPRASGICCVSFASIEIKCAVSWAK